MFTKPMILAALMVSGAGFLLFQWPQQLAVYWGQPPAIAYIAGAGLLSAGIFVVFRFRAAPVPRVTERRSRASRR